MNINQLRYFIAAAETLNFTRAAESLYITQTAMTQQIRALEASLGVSLFNRASRPMSLTPAGRVFLTEAKAVCERMDNAVERTRSASHGLSGSVRIGYIKGYERSELSVRLREFHEQDPNILLSCARKSAEELTSLLLSGELDIIFTWDNFGIIDEDGIDHLFREEAPLTVALDARHPFAHRDSLTRSDLKGERIIILSLSDSGSSAADSRYAAKYLEAGYRPDIVFSSPDAESVLMMVDAGEGIAILPSYMTAKLTNSENLVFVPLTGEGESESIYCLWRRDNPNAALQRLISFLSAF